MTFNQVIRSMKTIKPKQNFVKMFISAVERKLIKLLHWVKNVWSDCTINRWNHCVVVYQTILKW